MTPKEIDPIARLARDRKLHFFRNLGSEALMAMYEKLALLAAECDQIWLPTSLNGKVRPKLRLIENREINNNKPVIPEDFVLRPSSVRAIAEELPELLSPRKAVLTATTVSRSLQGTGVRYIHLQYHPAAAEQNGNERADLWHAIADHLEVSDADLEWREFDPNSLLCSLGPEVPGKVSDHLVRFVRKHLPLEVELLPMITPTQLAQVTAEAA